ncbi:MAG: hypothetical protein YYHSYBAR_001685 [Candidatus Fervidibacter sacchari]
MAGVIEGQINHCRLAEKQRHNHDILERIDPQSIHGFSTNLPSVVTAFLTKILTLHCATAIFLKMR